MRAYGIKLAISVAAAGFFAYFKQLAIPLVILFLVMVTDYVSGMVKAYMGAQLSSQRGIKGILKKLCYFILVVVGMVADWVLQSGLLSTGIDIDFGIIALLVTVWLIINELVSILENLAQIGVPAIPGLERLLKKLKTVAERIPSGGEEE